MRPGKSLKYSARPVTSGIYNFNCQKLRRASLRLGRRVSYEWYAIMPVCQDHCVEFVLPPNIKTTSGVMLSKS